MADYKSGPHPDKSQTVLLHSLHTTQHFEEVRIATAVEKRSRRKGFTSQSVPAAKSTDTTRFTCDDYGRQFTARIGLVGHSRTHRK